MMVDRKALSDIRQQIVWLREDRKKLEDSLFRPKKMIRASLVFLPNYCGKKDCRCKGKVKEIIDSLTLDRGYWGGHFLWKLKNRWGIDFVTLVRDDDLDFVKHVEYYLRGIEPTFKERWITITKRGKKEKKKIRICGISGLYLRRYSQEGKEKDLGKVNAVVVYDEKNGRMRRRIYVTTLDAEEDPFKIYELYKDRWTIENQGIRYLSQRWSLRDFAGRSLNSIQARIWTILMLYNAVKILEMKYEDKMEKLQDEMRQRGELS